MSLACVFNSPSGLNNGFGAASSGQISVGTPGALGSTTFHVAYIYLETNSTTSQTISSVTDSNGLTWTFKDRISKTTVGTPASIYEAIEVWTAHGSVAASNWQLTVACTGTVDEATGVVASFSGVTLATPFDPNGSFPAHADTGAGGSVPSSTVSTTNSDTYLIACAGNVDLHKTTAVTFGGAAAAFAGDNQNTGHVRNSVISIFGSGEYTSVQSGLAVAGNNSAQDILMVTLALTGGGAPVPTKSFGTIIG